MSNVKGQMSKVKERRERVDSVACCGEWIESWCRVESLEAAVRYYRDVVGLKLVRQDPRLASFRLGDGETELVLHDDADLPDQATYYLVDSVKDLWGRREELKLKFAGPPQPVSGGFGRR